MARKVVAAEDAGLPFVYRGDTLMWSEDRLMRWNEGAKDWIEGPVGLRSVVKGRRERKRTRRRSLSRDSVVLALLLSPFAALIAAAPKIFGTETLANIWFFVSLMLFVGLGYWIIRARS